MASTYELVVKLTKDGVPVSGFPVRRTLSAEEMDVSTIVLEAVNNRTDFEFIPNASGRSFSPTKIFCAQATTGAITVYPTASANLLHCIPLTPGGILLAFGIDTDYSGSIDWQGNNPGGIGQSVRIHTVTVGGAAPNA